MGRKEGGKNLNPADKLRKEQKQKEAKKNAERRTATRAAIVAKKTEDDLQSELQTILRAEKEGRADAKQMQLKKQIQERLTELEKEEEEKPQKTLSLEEMYPDAEGSVYYHPIENPYGVPPPGAFQMWKPGYVPKAQRHLLPFHHPLHPDYKPELYRFPPPPGALGHLPTAPGMVPVDASHLSGADESEDFDDEELRKIPPPPEEPDSDGENAPPAPPTTEDDLPNIVYDVPASRMVVSHGEEEGYFKVDDREDEMQPPRSKRSGPPGPGHRPPHGLPFPPGHPPGYPPPPFNGPPGSAPRGHRANGPPSGPRSGERRDGRPGDRHGPKKTKATDPGEIPDPLDNGPYKKENKGNAPAKSTSAAPPASAPPAAAAPTPTSSAAHVDTSATFGPMLVPSQLRGKRKAPVEARPRAVAPVAPSAPTSNASAAPSSAASSSSGSNGNSYDAFMSDMKNLGAIP